MLAQRHAWRELIEETSEDLFHTRTQLFSNPPSTSAVTLGPPFFPLHTMPRQQCPVLGCGSWRSSCGEKSYPLPSADVFTLQLNSAFDISINNRICRSCWKRHKDHKMALDGRIRVHPIAFPSPLDALLSAAIVPLLPPPAHLSSAPPVTSLPSLPSLPPPTPASVITPSPAYPSVTSCPQQVQQPSSTNPTTVLQQSHTSTSTVPRQSNTGQTVITSPPRTHSFPPVLDLSPAPATYSERQRDVVASVMAGIDYGKIDRDKAKHHQFKTSPAYNSRQKAIRVEKKTRTAEDPELIARAAVQKQKTREKQRHWYSARKQLLYEASERKEKGGAETGEGDDFAAATVVMKKKRGRPRKTVPIDDADKENVDPRIGPTESGKRRKTGSTDSTLSTEQSDQENVCGSIHSSLRTLYTKMNPDCHLKRNTSDVLRSTLNRLVSRLVSACRYHSKKS